jgi:hypothetical protein
MHLALMLAHHHRPDLQMPHRLSPSAGEPIEALTHLAAELAQLLLLDAMGDHPGDEIARQRPGRALPRHLEPALIAFARPYRRRATRAVRASLQQRAKASSTVTIQRQLRYAIAQGHPLPKPRIPHNTCFAAHSQRFAFAGDDEYQANCGIL